MRKIIIFFAALFFLTNVFALTTVIDFTVDSLQIPSLSAYLGGPERECQLSSAGPDYIFLEAVRDSQSGNNVIAKNVIDKLDAGANTKIAFQREIANYFLRIAFPVKITPVGDYGPYTFSCFLKPAGTQVLSMANVTCDWDSPTATGPCWPPWSAGPVGKHEVTVDSTNCISDTNLYLYENPPYYYDYVYPDNGLGRYCFFLGAI